MFDFLKQKRQAFPLAQGTIRRHYRIYGTGQGVGFRYRAQYAAQQLALTGWVRNMDDGSVEMELQGLPDRIDRIFGIIQQSDYVRVTEIRTRELPANPYENRFVVRD